MITPQRHTCHQLSLILVKLDGFFLMEEMFSGFSSLCSCTSALLAVGLTASARSAGWGVLVSTLLSRDEGGFHVRDAADQSEECWRGTSDATVCLPSLVRRARRGLFSCAVSRVFSCCFLNVHKNLNILSRAVHPCPISFVKCSRSVSPFELKRPKSKGMAKGAPYSHRKHCP